MRRSGVRTVALTMALFLALPALAAAQGKRGQGDAKWEERPQGPFARLDLSDEQREKIHQIMSVDDQEAVSLEKEMMRARHDLRGAFLQDAPDRAQVRKLVERIGEIRTKLHVRHLEKWLALRELLTEEQKDRLLLHGGPHSHDGPGGRWDRSARHGHRDGWGEGHCCGGFGSRSMPRCEFGRPSWR